MYLLSFVSVLLLVKAFFQENDSARQADKIVLT
jgi:hypothetical protein